MYKSRGSHQHAITPSPQLPSSAEFATTLMWSSGLEGPNWPWQSCGSTWSFLNDKPDTGGGKKNKVISASKFLAKYIRIAGTVYTHISGFGGLPIRASFLNKSIRSKSPTWTLLTSTSCAENTIQSLVLRKYCFDVIYWLYFIILPCTHTHTNTPKMASIMAIEFLIMWSTN